MRFAKICFSIIFLSISLAISGDQLQWNTREVCEKAAREIGREVHLVSYCSLSDSDYIEVWLIKEVVVAVTPDENLFEVNVFGRCLYRSRRPVREGQYSEPIEYEKLDEQERSMWFLKGIDLAYVYVPASKGSFRCLGKVLGLDCEVKVETISLPAEVTEDIEEEEELPTCHRFLAGFPSRERRPPENMQAKQAMAAW